MRLIGNGLPIGLLNISVFLLAACGSGSRGKVASQLDAISNRPQHYDQLITIVKMNARPLLGAAQRRGGRLEIADALRRRLLDEQEAKLLELKGLCPHLEVLYRYRLVLNAVALVIPRSCEQVIRGYGGFSYVENEIHFSSPKAFGHAWADAPSKTPTMVDTTAIIGARRVHEALGWTGRGIKVGVIDTGIDYAHKMFGGSGVRRDPAAGHAVADPFPTTKVSGFDLVGSDYDSASPDFRKHIPHPDANPMDEQGHGTHVAGTIAGVGDGVETYNGVAPDAHLFAMKVFGSSGSAGEASILAAFEMAADPNGDLQPHDHLDVVNLSLGDTFGTALLLYDEAISQLTSAGIVVVAAAGNAGATPYIVGSPSTSSDAISVAASAVTVSLESAASADANGAVIGTLADFSSRGPRAFDGFLKPEITAPGVDIRSADMGSGQLGAEHSGTSMAAPHVAGVLALLKQGRPSLSAQLLKAMVMGTARPMTDPLSGMAYSLSGVGAGQVHAYAAATAELAMTPPALSLGEWVGRKDQVVLRKVTMHNLTPSVAQATLQVKSCAGLTLATPVSVLQVDPYGEQSFEVAMRIDPGAAAGAELNGEVLAVVNGRTYRVPVLAKVQRAIDVVVSPLIIAGAPQANLPAAASVTLTNRGDADAEALLFNLLAENQVQQQPAALAKPCALGSAGWRLVAGDQGKTLLQIAVELKQNLTNWQLCEVSFQVFSEEGGEIKQELLGTNMQSLTGDEAQTNTFASVLTDAAMMRQLRRNYELSQDPSGPANYTGAILDVMPFQAYPQATVAVLSVDYSRLAKTADGTVLAKLAVLGDSFGPNTEEYLGGPLGTYFRFSPAREAFQDLPARSNLAAGQTQTWSFRRSATPGQLVVYMPYHPDPLQGRRIL